MAEVGTEKTEIKGGATECVEFRSQATPPDQLDELCFTQLPGKPTTMEEGSGGSVAEVSCASSACSVSGNGNWSDGGSGHTTKGNANVQPPEQGISEQINAKLVKRTTSRHGRSSQRWATDPLSHSSIRLTTGVVPLLRDGNILFVSASSKPAWIFPKGGWESDEKMEESALREAFEEAGIIGILGPRLSEVQYETRKAKKRRMESEEALKNKRGKAEVPGESPETGVESVERDGRRGDKSPATEEVAPSCSFEGSKLVVDPADNPAPVSDEAFSKMRAFASNTERQDDTSSIKSDSNYNQVRMSLFPLYVTTIKREWPENDRLRRAVPIKDALDILEARPELRSALEEVMRRGLHKPENLTLI